MKKNVAQAVELLNQATALLNEVLTEETSNTTSAPTKPTLGGAKKPTTSVPAPTANKPASSAYTPEQLAGMGFNDLKKLAASIGVKPTGKRPDIEAAILSACGGSTPAPSGAKPTIGKPAPVPTPAAKAPVPANVKGGLKVPSKAQAEEEQAPESDPLHDLVNSYDDADLKEVLKSIGVSAVGKHEALVDKVVKAINEGKIDNPLEAEATEGEAEVEAEAQDIGEMFPQFAVNYTDDMTAERAEALEGIRDEIFAEGVTFEESALDEAIGGFMGDNYDPNAFTYDDKVIIYSEIRMLFVDDDGAENEEKVAYNIDGVPYCCGVELDYNKAKKQFVCSVCATKYDAQ